MRVVTYNIQFGRGRDGRYDIDRTAQALLGADIVGLQEAEAYWDRSGNVHQVEHIAAALGDYHVVYGATVDIHKTVAGVHRRRRFGNAVLSRWPILTTRTFLFPKLSPLNAHSIQRGLTEATIETPLGVVRVYTSHFSHLCTDERMQHAQLTLETHRRAAADGAVTSGTAVTDHGRLDPSWSESPLPAVPPSAILMGDLNFTPDDPPYALLTGPRSPRYGRLQRPDGFVDTWTAAGNAEEDGHTLYRDMLTKRGKRIDYILATPDLAERVESAVVLTDTEASDHQPVATTFTESPP
ncbi:endonuclease/exonuclease/phosphatase family protein [Pseudonocardia xinjiangensis]|uniref:Hydrolase n=1 Tax=Pseudonocardia xinjiangensis TaxID=75289 RepID=A0ABX1RII0_9PSEU|nr:endonuclease/exonuclease/phosphatase family protein [Pseudonocardia xinjiangensis]NMH80206.1 hydrolase [Pseudonocardia xinjiangensis]